MGGGTVTYGDMTAFPACGSRARARGLSGGRRQGTVAGMAKACGRQDVERNTTACRSTAGNARQETRESAARSFPTAFKGARSAPRLAAGTCKALHAESTVPSAAHRLSVAGQAPCGRWAAPGRRACRS